MDLPEFAIEATGLVKTYPATKTTPEMKALRGIDLAIPRGSIFGLLGPNGAGKTNILEAVSLLSPGRGLRRSSASDMTRRPEALGWKITAHLHSLGQIHEVEIWSSVACL